MIPSQMEARLRRIIKSSADRLEASQEEVELLQLNDVWRRQIALKKNSDANNQELVGLAELCIILIEQFKIKTSPYEAVDLELKRLAKIADSYDQMKSDRDEAVKALEQAQVEWKKLNDRVTKLEKK